jgi:hypothetical protein
MVEAQETESKSQEGRFHGRFGAPEKSLARAPGERGMMQLAWFAANPVRGII